MVSLRSPDAFIPLINCNEFRTANCWSISRNGQRAADQRSYKYTYDKSDRLTAATFQVSFVPQTGPMTWDKETNTLNETLTYDANGNILTLVRKRNLRGLSGTSITSTPQTIDDLAYVYQGINGGSQNTNRLVRVNEAVSGTTGEAGFKNGADSNTEFTFYNYGSVAKDLNKGISRHRL